jgi:endogenous inhibitor of DNA gyrase (YacG/DUF329 family)
MVMTTVKCPECGKVFKVKSVNGYYGSELNKFVDEYCSRKMTVNNIDLIMYKYKAYKKHIRIIESKHLGECMKTGQKRLLELLAELGKILEQHTDYKLEVLIASGNPPYNNTKLKNLGTGSEKIVTQEQLIRYLNFEDGE